MAAILHAHPCESSGMLISELSADVLDRCSARTPTEVPPNTGRQQYACRIGEYLKGTEAIRSLLNQFRESQYKRCCQPPYSNICYNEAIFTVCKDGFANSRCMEPVSPSACIPVCDSKRLFPC